MRILNKFSTSKSYSYKLIPILLLSIAILASCVKAKKQEPELQSAINIVNATVDMPALSFSINKNKLKASPLKYTEETGYFITFPGSREFDVMADGITDPVLKTNLTFKVNTYHSIFIVGKSNSISTYFTDDDLSKPASGKSKIRFVHLSPDGGNLVLSLKNGTALTPEQTYKTASDFVSIDPGMYDLQLKTATGSVLLEKNVTIVSGSIYNVWAKGLRFEPSNSSLGLQFSTIN